MRKSGDDERLRRLSERIAEVRRTQEPASRTQEHHTQAQMAWRMVTELVAGLLVGFGIGYGLDVLLGTRPILLVLFTLLGFAAGVRTMLRTASDMQAAREREDAEERAAGRPGTEEQAAGKGAGGQEREGRRG